MKQHLLWPLAFALVLGGRDFRAAKPAEPDELSLSEQTFLLGLRYQ